MQNTTSIRVWTCNTRILFLEFSLFSKPFHFNMNKWAKRGLKFGGGMGRLFVLSWCLMQQTWMWRFLLTIKEDSPGITIFAVRQKKRKFENTKKLNFRFTDHHGYENLLLLLKWYTYKNEHFILNIIIYVLNTLFIPIRYILYICV